MTSRSDVDEPERSPRWQRATSVSTDGVLAIVDCSDAGLRAAAHAGQLASTGRRALTVVLVVPAMVLITAFAPEVFDHEFRDDYVLGALRELVPLLDGVKADWSLRTVLSVSVSGPMIGDLAATRDLTTVVAPSVGRPWQFTRRQMARTARRLASGRRSHVALVFVD